MTPDLFNRLPRCVCQLDLAHPVGDVDTTARKSVLPCVNPRALMWALRNTIHGGASGDPSPPERVGRVRKIRHLSLGHLRKR